jgi:hypothetical protein
MGDGFPNCEAFVRIGDGRAILLHSYQVPPRANLWGSTPTDGVTVPLVPIALSGPYLMLWGDGTKDMGSNSVTIQPTRPPADVPG